VAEAEGFLAGDDTILARMNRVARLIEGFEDPSGLELLSSVHWVMQHNPESRENPEMAAAAVHKWNARKRRTLKKEHILTAWERPRGQDWNEAFSTA
jgi:hypothetical protein